jgi:hypothetical protein
MYSKLLEQYGLKNKIAGTESNFRYHKIGKAIVENVSQLEAELQVNPKEVYSGQQTHSANIVYVDGENGESFAFGKTFKDTDGLITDKANVALLIKFADCTPVVLFDPIKKVQASVHSGWRGTVQQISAHAVERMISEFGCQKENILAYVGPSIDQENYEVGSEVYEAFKDFPERDTFFQSKDNGKYLLSMLDANLAILKNYGIDQAKIEVERASTYTDERLHSARLEGGEYGLNAIMTIMEE